MSMQASGRGQPFIALDWGTSNRRAYLVGSDGAVQGAIREGAGVLGTEPDAYPEAFAAIRSVLGPYPILAAGMIGSSRGWREVAYRDAPAGLEDIAAGVARFGLEDVAIVPGVCRREASRPDVMRGEEVQVLGAIAAGLAPADAVFCQPGTHTKWIVTQGARITDFSTVMTGEIFALLRTHSVLSEMLQGDVRDGSAFRDGLRRGGSGCDVTAALFEVRAGVLLETLRGHDAAAYASGILIGADVGPRELAGRDVHLLASGHLAELYSIAIKQAGGRVVAVEAEAVFVAGARAVQELLN